MADSAPSLADVVDLATGDAIKWVRRVASPDDRRSILAQLTAKGEVLFEQIFPTHIHYLRE